MELVLGISMTSTAVRLVLVEGARGDGATIGNDTRDINRVRALAGADPREVVVGVLGEGAIKAYKNQRLRSIGLTWADEAATEASTVLEALAASGFDNVVTVTQSDAADALAAGIRGIGGYDDAAVCVVEPDEAIVVITDPGGLRIENIWRAVGDDPHELARGIVAVLDLDSWTPETVFVLGSAEDLDQIEASLSVEVPSPVLSAAEAGLALARGAALASARAMGGRVLSVDDVPAGKSRRRLTPKVGAVASVLVAAGVTFAISLSMALGMSFGSESESVTAEQLSDDSAEAPLAAQEPQAAEAVPEPPAAVPAQEAPPVAEATIVADAIPAPEVLPPEPPAAEPEPAPPPAAAPVEPPPAYVPPVPVAPPPPAPVYIPPGAPAAAPPPGAPAAVPPAPQQPPPQPRLRDRIIERIPILNRFHEPEYVP